MILDEATSEIDLETETKILHNIKKISRNYSFYGYTSRFKKLTLLINKSYLMKSTNQNKENKIKILFPFVGDSYGGAHLSALDLINYLEKKNLNNFNNSQRGNFIIFKKTKN